MNRLEGSLPDGNSLEHKEHPVMVQADLIPTDLKEYPRPQWVCWRYVFRGEGKKPDKRPINPKTLGNAGPHWPNSWSTFDTAYTTYLRHQGLNTSSHLDGVGFFLTVDDPYTAIDIDSCVSEEGITTSASEVVQTLESYTEISPSFQGLRILVASQSIDNCKSKELEMYSHSRYVTLTGNHVDGTPLEITKVDPSTLQSLRLPQPPVTIPTLHDGKPFIGSAAELWARIFEHDKYGEAHRQRFMGSTSLDQEDHSLAVIRLLNALARWTDGDATRMRHMMLQSPLANEKWFSKRGNGNRDWLDYQIADAIRYVKHH